MAEGEQGAGNGEGEATEHACEFCGGADATLGPDPYAEEIHGDATERWECAACRYESARDI